MSPIDTVIFDIGRVLVRLEFSAFLRYIGSHGVGTEQVEELLERIELADYEQIGRAHV